MTRDEWRATQEKILHPAPLASRHLSRVNIVGVTGSGKTTFARQLAQHLSYPHIEMDALHWEPNWVEAPWEVFRARIDLALRGDTWVIDGNYSRARDIVWSRADTVVWLDYTLPLILWRLTIRTFRRVFMREDLWNGNRENFGTQFLSRDSLFLWVLQTYPRRRREYPDLFARPEHAHLCVVRLHSPRDADAWLKSVTCET